MKKVFVIVIMSVITMLAIIKIANSYMPVKYAVHLEQ